MATTARTATMAIAILTAFGIRAQTSVPATTQAFEIASVKQSKAAGDRNSMVNGPAGITYTNVTLKACLRTAYDLQDYQITGPPWLNADRFDIVAKAEGHATREQLSQMLQTLLADRFQMKSHRESKELPVYELAAAKNGPKHFEKPESDAAPRRRMTNGNLVFTNAPISLFTEYLQRLQVVGRPVLDATGLKGNYDFTLNLIETNPDSKGEQGEAAMRQALEQGIFSMVKEQLGLQLVPRKSMVDLLVIDHAERVPTQN